MTALQDAQTWLYHLGDVNTLRADAIAATNADLVVTEWASYANDEAPYTSNRLDRMRGDDDKIIVSYLSIGEAETYLYYWEESWEDTPPSWIDDANPEWIDNINVKYWNADWQDIIFDYVDQIVTAGFDGVYLDLVSAYEYWEEKNPNATRDYRDEMAQFVAAIEAHANATREALEMEGDFYIIGQNALELIENDTYLDAIDGIGKEDLQFYYEYGSASEFETLSNSEYTYHLNLLKKAEKAGIATFVVEYVPDSQVDGASDTLNDEAADLGDLGIPIYVAAGRDLDEITTQPVAVMNGVFAPLGLSGGTFWGTDAGDVMLGTADADNLNGAAGADAIVAGKGADILRGGKGNDEIIGGNGADTIFGDNGNDDLSGKNGDDAVSGDAGADVLNGNSGSDALLGGSGSDLLRGNENADVLRGGKGADDLLGGNGADTLHGDKGGDVLTGGNGADIFVFAAGSGEDEITDYTTDDLIDLGGRDAVSVTAETGGVYIDIGGGDGVFLLGLSASDIDDIAFL